MLINLACSLCLILTLNVFHTFICSFVLCIVRILTPLSLFPALKTAAQSLYCDGVSCIMADLPARNRKFLLTFRWSWGTFMSVLHTFIGHFSVCYHCAFYLLNLNVHFELTVYTSQTFEQMEWHNIVLGLCFSPFSHVGWLGAILMQSLTHGNRHSVDEAVDGLHQLLLLPLQGRVVSWSPQQLFLLLLNDTSLLFY